MRKVGGLTAVSVMSLAAALGADVETGRSDATVPADFKLVIRLYGAAREPVQKSELVCTKGRAYLFVSERPLEVVMHDSRSSRLELVDLGRKLRSEVTFKKLDAARTNLQAAIAAVCAKRESSGGRANKLAAAMSRDLIDPRFTASYDEQTHRLRLTNPTVEVDARGAPEEDGARLSLIGSTLTALIELESLRDPQATPPFARLDTIRALTVDHRLRPTETTFLYRLSGPPKKHRWSYELVPSLTAREVEAIARVETIRSRSTLTRFERYERPGSP
jgi:hypothetical protein